MLDQLGQFMEAGGWVLYVIAFVTFLMWALIFERLWFFLADVKNEKNSLQDAWRKRDEHHSWYAKQIRRQYVSLLTESINSNLPLIRTLVALCPLFGLLGTVWGMIEVFNVMAMTGGGDAKAMASGVSKATIPTMAGMVAALSGVFANTLLTKMSEKTTLNFEDALVVDHHG